MVPRFPLLFCLLISVPLSVSANQTPASSTEQTPALAEIETLSKQGQTIPAEMAGTLELPRQRVRNDTGINVLTDLAHQATFVAMWSLPRELRNEGFRVSGSQATLNTVLDSANHSRVRMRAGNRRPFAWWPNAKWDVVFTFQESPLGQVYLPEEIAALQDYVQSGGGLVVACGNQFDQQRIDPWSLNRLLKGFGAELRARSDRADDRRVTTLSLQPQWEVIRQGEKGLPVVAPADMGQRPSGSLQFHQSLLLGQKGGR